MNEALANLTLACASFAGSHLLLSGPLRARLVRMLGERGFLALYSLIAFAAIGWAIHAFDRTPPGQPLWNRSAPLPWLLTSLITLAAMVLLVGSFSSNPALPQANLAGLSARKPWGVFRVTRHPMMMGIALWAISHVIIAPTARGALFNLTLAGLALFGAHQQDRRKLAQSPREWGVWVARTSFWPDLRQARGLGAVWPIALLAWVLATAAHLAIADIPAGLWKLAV